MDKEKVVVIESIGEKKLCDKISGKLNSTKDLYKALEIVLFVVLCFQFLAIAYFNLFQIKYHLGYDVSSIILKGRMLWEQKTLFPDNYVEQNNLLLGSSMPVAALIYGICGDICLAFGITNVLSTSCIVVLFYFIAKKLSLSRIATLFGLVFLLTPYVSPCYNTANNIDYFPAVLFSAAFMSVIVIYALVVFAAVLYLSDKNSNRIITAIFSSVAVIMTFYLAVSRGIVLFMYTAAPILLYLVIKTLVHKDIRYFFNKILGFFAGISVAIIGGQLYMSKVVDFHAKTDVELVQLGNFWENFGNVFLGLGKLMNVGNAFNVTKVASLEGILYLVNLCIFAMYLFGVIYAITHIVKHKDFMENNGICFVLCFCFVNFFAYAFLNTTYGSPIFEERYLVLYFVISLFLLMYFIDKFDSDFFKKLGILFAAVVVTLSSAGSYYSMNRNKDTVSCSLAELLEKYDETTVYGYDMSDNLGILIRKMRVVDDSKIYKLITEGNIHHWGDYTYGDDIGDNMGPVLLLVRAGSFEQLPDYLRYNFIFSESFGDYEIYKSEKNVFDFETGLDDDGYSVDIPNTYGVTTANMSIDENGEYITDGTEGYCMYGPYAPTMAGKYRFTLNYNVKFCADGKNAGSFDIAVNNGTLILGLTNISSSAQSASIEVEFSEGDTFEYRIWNYPDSIVTIESVEMEKLN